MKRLERSRTDRVLLGICGGFGRYFGVDPDVVRVVWIFAALAGGIGLIPYVAAIFLMPEPSPGGQEGGGRQDRKAKNVGLILVALAGIVFLRQSGLGYGPWFPGWGLSFRTWHFLLPLVLVLAGVFLIWPRTREAVGFSSGRKLRRSVTDRVLAGVAGGIAKDAGVDPNLVRLAFVLVTVLTTGAGALLYVLLVLVLPEEDVVPTSGPPAPVAPTAPVASEPSPPRNGPEDGQTAPDQAPSNPGR